jgi:hypothetical protein
MNQPMNRITTAMLAALEALIVVAIGVGIALVPLTILWATHFDLAVDWLVFWRAAVDIWLLGNGVDLTVTLDPVVAASLGLPGAEAPFPLTMALLGFAVLATLLGVRTGTRAAESAHRSIGVASAILVYGILAALLTVSAGTAVVEPSLVQGIVLPTAIYALGVLIGSEMGRRRSRADDEGLLSRLTEAVEDRYRQLPDIVRATIAAGLRGGTAIVAVIVAVAAVIVTVLIVVNYATIIGLYETLQAGIMGGITLTLAQLALIPNLVFWAVAWLIGPGIAMGVGTSVSPVGTVLGTVPGLPILGALPQGSGGLGFLGLLVPVLAGFICAVLIRQRMPDDSSTVPAATSGVSRTREYALSGVAMGLVAGILIGLLAWWSAGAMGPGRLAEVGPNPLVVGALAALEIGIGATAGMLVGGRKPAFLSSARSETKR